MISEHIHGYIKSHHITSPHITSHHITTHHMACVPILSYCVPSNHGVIRRTYIGASWKVVSCDVMFSDVAWCVIWYMLLATIMYSFTSWALWSRRKTTDTTLREEKRENGIHKTWHETHHSTHHIGHDTQWTCVRQTIAYTRYGSARFVSFRFVPFHPSPSLLRSFVPSPLLSHHCFLFSICARFIRTLRLLSCPLFCCFDIT